MKVKFSLFFIINIKFIVVHGTDGTYIRVGSTYRLKGFRVQVILHLIHPSYQRHHEFDYDVQLLKLFQPLRFGRSVNQVRICDGSCGKLVEVYGWGYSKEKGEYNDLLQGMVTKVVPLEDCQKVQKPQYNNTLTARMFCAERNGVDACQGDSGGAAISSGQLVGLSSFGFGCGRGLPGVYTNITNYDIKTWILNHTSVGQC